MGVHLVFCGPAAAGKTSLMLGLAQLETERTFTIDRPWTTRRRRVGEGDEENILVTDEVFEANRERFLMTFSNYSEAKYGFPQPEPVADDEVRMRILRPSLALPFRLMVPEPVVICSISPFTTDPGPIILRRDPDVSRAEYVARVDGHFTEEIEAIQTADIHFQNYLGLDRAVRDLANLALGHFAENDL